MNLPTLIPEWKKLHRIWSVQLAFANAVLGVLWLFIPSIENLIDLRTYIRLCVVLAIATLLARLVKQDLDGNEQ